MKNDKFLYDIYFKDISEGYIYNGKPIIPTYRASVELIEINVGLNKVKEILEKGFELTKRKKGIAEKGLIKGKKLIKVVVVDTGNYYKLIHVGKISLSKKFRKKMQNESGQN